jgi:hypothetical protein
MLKWLVALRQPPADASAGAVAQDAESRAKAAARTTMAELYVALASAAIKGALSHLNMACNVLGTCDAAPACAPPARCKLRT